MYITWYYWLFILTISFHVIVSLIEKKSLPAPGRLIDINGHTVHLCLKGTGKVTVILEHSLGGVEGYFLMDKIAKLTQVCIYDRPGYGWSQLSQKSPCSAIIAEELDLLLTKAKIKPPYILVGV